jgi:hypothetical protein
MSRHENDDDQQQTRTDHPLFGIFGIRWLFMPDALGKVERARECCALFGSYAQGQPVCPEHGGQDGDGERKPKRNESEQRVDDKRKPSIPTRHQELKQLVAFSLQVCCAILDTVGTAG